MSVQERQSEVFACSVWKCQLESAEPLLANKTVAWGEGDNPEMHTFGGNKHENGTEVGESNGSAPAGLACWSETAPA